MPLYAGAPWAQQVQLLNPDGSYSDMTGIPLRMQIRPTYDSSTVYVDMTTANSKIVYVTPTQAIFNLTLSGTDTASLPVGSQAFDVIRTDTGVRLFGGKIVVKGLVTR